MSRKQWGHGYYAGLKEADAHLGVKRYIAILHTDNHFLTGMPSLFEVSGKDDDIVHENVSEIKGTEDMIFFSSKQACESWVINDYKKYCTEVLK